MAGLGADRIHVRTVCAADEAAWRDLFAQYIAFYEADIPPHVIDLTWRRVLASSDGFVGLVAEAGSGPSSELAGLANLVFHASTWSATAYCYLEDLYVLPAARGAGVGRALIGATYAEADRQGATRTYWATRQDNSRARRLYDAVGELSPFVLYTRPGSQ